jgi:hypothetical protein
VTHREAGLSTIQYVAATGLSLLVFVALANFVVDLYARGAVRAAVDEAARAGAPIDTALDACERRARDVLDHLLGGQLRSGVQVECSDGSDTVRAHAEVVLPSWFPAVVPDWNFSITGSAVKEHEP